MVKQVSRSSFVGAHIGVIVFHILLGAFILFATWKAYRIGLYVAGSLLIVLSFCSLAPVLKKTEWRISA